MVDSSRPPGPLETLKKKKIRPCFSLFDSVLHWKFLFIQNVLFLIFGGHLGCGESAVCGRAPTSAGTGEAVRCGG